jgi:hypothetical protein
LEHASVVLLHHHVLPYGRSTDAIDYSLLKEASDVLDIAKQHRACLVLHGHQHRAAFEQLQGSSGPVAVFGAGSVAAPLSRLPTETTNSFHVVRFEPANSGKARGHVHTRVLNRSSGWQRPNWRHHNVEPRYPFGTLVGSDELHQWVKQTIDEFTRAGVVKLDRFLRTQPNGQYVCISHFVGALRFELASANMTEDRDFEFLVHPDNSESVQLQRAG